MIQFWTSRVCLPPRRWVLLGALVVLLLASTVPAQADSPSLSITNLGQPSAPVQVGQPPITILATASCAYPFTLTNESACVPGTWPQLGRQWGPIEHVAGGDTLRLELPVAVSSVTASSTSNYERGLHDPDGNAIPNFDVLSEASAVPTGEQGVWTIALPSLDYRAISTHGYTFSVVAQDDSGYHDYAFGIRSPRFTDELEHCGQAVYSTGVEQGMCWGVGVPPLGPRTMVKPENGPFEVRSARYDGRVLSLKISVPTNGKLVVAVPVTCRFAPAGHCSRTVNVVRHIRLGEVGQLIVSRALDLRIGHARKITIQLRLSTPPHELRTTTSTVPVKH
jgi:hypothetical protein